MNIQGFNKLTLLDYPGLTACTVFTGGCDLRCPFCHNSPLVLDPRGTEGYTVDEVLGHLKKRKGILDGIAISGGEPLLQPDLEDFMRRIRDIGDYKIKLDTNGTHPERLASIISEGLCDKVAMDIKNSPSKYAVTAGVEEQDFVRIAESIKIISESGINHEFRTTVTAELHTCEDIEAICNLLHQDAKYYLQSYRDEGDIMQKCLSVPTEEQISELLQVARRRLPLAQKR